MSAVPGQSRACRRAGEPVELLQDVVDGLTGTPKRLPSKYLYDRRGSELFDRICELEEYYLTRTELTILRRHAQEMADRLGPRCLLIEPGSGNSLKIRLLLERLDDTAAYVPVDISKEHMTRWAQALRREFPGLRVLPVHTDFCHNFTVPHVPGARRRVVYFPGSTIGNLTPAEAVSLMAKMARIAGHGGGLLIGIDLKKDVSVLEEAYNDQQGVTRAFNLNLLSRLRRELHADVCVDGFEHRAFYNEAEGRIEMHLVSKVRQSVRLNHTQVEFTPGETIHTENSYKYDLEQFRRMAAQAGWKRAAYWTDEDDLFSVQYYETAP
ncbi:MAG: L-histidine N(alpha)-methyltransferase [Planctomycetota bacterium]|jgi:dimethylhistidine N-methyltransferase